MKIYILLIVVLITLLGCKDRSLDTLPQQSEDLELEWETCGISQERVRQIAQLLPEEPQGMSVSHNNRLFWDRMKTDKHAEALLNEIPTLISKGMPPFEDELYLDLKESNNRVPGEQMMRSRFGYLFKLVWAECMDNQGRYIKAIESALLELCAQKPWSIPAHDVDLGNYYGKNYYVDLTVATWGNGIAQCMWMLEDCLSSEVKQAVQKAFHQKVFNPILKSLRNGEPFWWFTSTNNWNSVCLAGVTGAALTLLQDCEERAFFVAVAEKYNIYGMMGYDEDGYCSEGVSYYNYGFGAYILLKEEVCRATDGKIDFFNTPKISNIVHYGDNVQMAFGVCPSFSDNHKGEAVDDRIIRYCDNACGNAGDEEQIYFPADIASFSMDLPWCFSYKPYPIQSSISSQDKYRSYFSEAGVLVVRPATDSSCRLSAAMKAGHNAENHNHNDVGSYVLALGKEIITGDQGGPASYPGDYFAANSYDKYPIKGSLGHPVPLVDNETQMTGEEARGIVLNTVFEGEIDTFIVDLTAAYHVEQLNEMKRTFVYDRNGKGSFLVTDEYSAGRAMTFETALTTSGTWEKIDENHLLLMVNDEKMKVEIKASQPFELVTSRVELPNGGPVYDRIGIRMRTKIEAGYITLSMIPL